MSYKQSIEKGLTMPCPIDGDPIHDDNDYQSLRLTPNLSPSISKGSIVALSYVQRLEYQQRWDKILLTNQKPFVPTNSQAQNVTVEEARVANCEFGKFSSSYRDGLLYETSPEDRARRVSEGRILLMGGYGLGFDSKGLIGAATHAGLKVVLVDVSKVACELAKRDFATQWAELNLPDKHLRTPPLVICAEFQSFLAKPRFFGFSVKEIRKVEVWYLCRLIGCLSEESARMVLAHIGSVSFSTKADPKKRNLLIFINALENRNCDYSPCTSRMYTKAELVELLSEGAGVKVEATRWKHHEFLSKIVTATTFTTRGQEQ